MKILISGAHFTPAQAVIEELIALNSLRSHLKGGKQNNSQFKQPIEIVYVGRRYTQEGDKTPSLESQVLPELGVNFLPITAGRLRRFISFGTLVSLLKIPIGSIQAFYYLVKEQPNVVLSFGGYVGVPVVVSAWLLNIPVIVHEQTLVSGLANKISAIFANKIAVSFERDYPFMKEKIVLTGNPIRRELLHYKLSKNVQMRKIGINLNSELAEFIKQIGKEKMPLIYITGGNQGSHIINETVKKILSKLLEKNYVIHQTGDSQYKDFDSLEAERVSLKNADKYLVRKWFNVNEVQQIFESADLVISRAGMNTLLELAYFGIPTIVIPITYLYQDEQNINAKFFNRVGLCEIIPQNSLTSEKLLDLISEILKKHDKYLKKAKNAREIVIEDAAKRLTLEVLKLAK